MKLSQALLAGTLFFCASGFANSRISREDHVKNLQVLVFPEFTFFSRTGGSLSGVGPGLTLRYGLSARTAVSLSMSQGLTVDAGNLAALYSSFRSSFYYAFSGSFLQTRSSYKSEGQSILEVEEEFARLLYVYAGFDQFLLNGTTSVYPATGLTVGVGVSLWKWDRAQFFSEVGSGILVLNRNLSFPMAVRLGVYWSY